MAQTKEADPLLGRVLGGRYRIDKRLGAGGMGVVYEATQLDLARRVAVKVLSELSGDATRELRLEAMAAAKLQSPHVVTVLDFQTSAGEPPFLVMERLEGCSLAAALAHGGPMAAERAARIAVQVLSGLAVAHEAGVLHRDVKPSNVWLVPGNEAVGPELAKLLDFGIARFDHDERIRTTTGTVKGTPGWLAPEQIRGLPADARSDLHAVGVLLFLMLTGRLPWTPTASRSVAIEILERAPAPLDEIVPGVPAAMARVVAALLAKDPAARPATASDAASALAPFARHAETARHAERTRGAPEPVRPRPAAPRAAQEPRRLLPFALGILLSILVAGAFTVGVAISRRASAVDAPDTRDAAVAQTTPAPAPEPPPQPSTTASAPGHALASPPPRPPPTGPATIASATSSTPHSPAPRCRCFAEDGVALCAPPADGPRCECDVDRKRLCLVPPNAYGGCDGAGRDLPTPAKVVVGAHDQQIPCEGWRQAPEGGAVKLRGTVHCYWCQPWPPAAPLTAGSPCRGVTDVGVAREGVASCM